MSAALLPTTKEVHDLYEMLLGRTAEVSPNYETLEPDGEFGCCVVFFSDTTGAICMACIMDSDLRVYTEAVLQLIPAAGVQDCINNECLDGNYIEDVYEILNVLSSLSNKKGTPHVSTGLMYTPGEELPADEYKIVTSYVERRDSVLDVGGYGKGRFGVMCFN